MNRIFQIIVRIDLFLSKSLIFTFLFTDFKPGGTLHMVASAAPPPVSNTPQASQTPPTQTPPTTTPQPRQANVLMGVIPSSGAGAPNLDQLLNSVLSSVGIAVNQQNNSAGSANQQNASPNVPFQSLHNLVQSLENQVNIATNQQVQQSPPNNEHNTSIERLGNLMTRIANSMNRLQPIVDQLGNQLANESTLTSEARQSTQQTITRVAPAIQQLGSALAIVTSSMRSIQLGENPGQASVNDTSDDSHRTFIGPHGNVTVHIGNSNNERNPNLDVNNLVQGIFSSLSGQQNSANTSQPSANNNNNNATNQQSQPQASQPNPAPNASSNNQSSSTNVPAGNSQGFNFMNMINQLASNMDQNSPPTVASANAAASASIPNVIQNLLSGLNVGRNNNQGGDSSENRSSTGPDISSLLETLTQTLGIDAQQSIGSYLNLEREYPSNDLMNLFAFFLHNLTFANLIEIKRGNKECIERLHPQLQSHLRRIMDHRSNDEFVSNLIESLSATMNEELLPEEIKNKRKPGVNLTQITLRILEDRFKIIVDQILNNPFSPTPSNPAPFSQFITNWTNGTVGITTDALAEGMTGGVEDGQSVINFFLSQRLYLLHSSFGPMIASLMTPMIVKCYDQYKENYQNDQNQNQQDDDQMEIDNMDAISRNTNNLNNNSIDDFSEIESVIENDVLRQENQSAQRPFSDAYSHAIPIAQRRHVFGTNELRNPSGLLQNHFKDALDSSGVVNSGDMQSFENIVENNDTLTSLYMEEIQKSLQERINTDTDFEESKFPNATKFLRKK